MSLASLFPSVSAALLSFRQASLLLLAVLSSPLRPHSAFLSTSPLSSPLPFAAPRIPKSTSLSRKAPADNARAHRNGLCRDFGEGSLRLEFPGTPNVGPEWNDAALSYYCVEL